MAFGGILIGSISGLVAAVLALSLFGAGWIAALGIYALGGTLTALLAIGYAMLSRERSQTALPAQAQGLRLRG
ncbi:MAG: hypothetical protein ACLFRU_09470 [Paracoccaceae bacterium]